MPYSPKRRIELQKKINWWGVGAAAVVVFFVSMVAGKWIGQALLNGRVGVKTPPSVPFTPAPFTPENQAVPNRQTSQQNVNPPALEVPPPVVEPTPSESEEVPSPEETEPSQASPSPPAKPVKSPAHAKKTSSSPKAGGSPKSPASPAAQESGEIYKVQVGVFNDRANADDLVSELSQQAYGASVEEFSEGGKTIYRVYTGPYKTRASAKSAVDALTTTGYSAFIVAERR